MTARRLRGRAGAAAVVLAVAGSLLSCADGSDARPAQPAPPEPTAAASATVEYAPGLTEDLYVPSRAQGQVPLVVLVPGGSWTTADPSGLAPLAARLADAGVAAAPTHLRAAQDGVTFPVPVEDVLCAVAALPALAEKKITEITKATTPHDDLKPNSAAVPEAYAISGQFERIVVLRFKYEADLLAGMEKLVKQ